LVKSTTAWRRRSRAKIAAPPFSAELRRFLQLARSLLMCWHGRRTIRRPVQGRQTMTFANIHTAAFSLFAAVVTSLVLVSAAIGPVAQFA